MKRVETRVFDVPGVVERMKGVVRFQHWIVVVLEGVVTRAGAMRWVVVVFLDGGVV